MTTAAVRELTRSDEERAVEASLREEAAREALVRDASAFCRREIMKKRGAGEIDPLEERLGYEPVTGVAYVVGELTSREPDGTASATSTSAASSAPAATGSPSSQRSADSDPGEERLSLDGAHREAADDVALEHEDHGEDRAARAAMPDHGQLAPLHALRR